MMDELQEVFEQRLALAPDPERVLDGMRCGIRRRRARRVVATVAGAAMVAALGVVAVTGALRDDPPDAAAKRGVERTTTIALGWVPDGLRPPTIESTDAGDEFSYDTRVASHYLNVWVDNLGWSPPFDTALGPHESWIQVNGRPARLTLGGGYAEVAFELPSGRWAVVARGDNALDRYVASPETLRDQAVRVAEAVRDGAGVTLRVGFEPNYLPPGQRIIGVRVAGEQPSGFGTIITAGGPMRTKRTLDYSPGQGPRGPKIIFSDLAPGMIISLAPADSGLPPDWADHLSPGTGPSELVAFHGGMLTVSPGLSDTTEGLALPRNELTKVANGMRWVG